MDNETNFERAVIKRLDGISEIKIIVKNAFPIGSLAIWPDGTRGENIGYLKNGTTLFMEQLQIRKDYFQEPVLLQ